MSSTQTIKYIAKTFFVTLGVFVFLYVFFHTLDRLYVFSVAEKNINAFHYGIDNDLHYLKERGDEVAQSSLVIKSLLDKDSVALTTYLKAEREHRGIGLMGVTNSNGVIIGRTKTSNKRGDNAFLTNPVGAVVAEGRSAASVEAPIGFGPRQIFLTTGRPIFFEGKMIGALFANYLTDDIYARRFKYMYLPKGSEIAFYHKKDGVYGVSFTDEDLSGEVRKYFDTRPSWLRGELSNEIVKFDEKIYLIENIVFPGLNASPGGALLFIPRKNTDSTARGVTILITSLVLGYFGFRYYRHVKENK